VAASRLRIGFVTIHAAEDRSAYSGSAYAMRQAFCAHPEVSLTDIGGLATFLYPLWRAKQAVYWFGFGKRYWMNRQPAVLDRYARQAAAKAADAGPLDLLFSPSSIPLARYAGPIPTAFWSDATFDCLADFYPEASDFAPETVAAGHRMEAESLRRCSLAVYSSAWAMESAATVYGAPRSKLKAVPYGANIEPQTGPPDAESLIGGRLHHPWRMLFIGSHWQRKGGDLAVEAAGELVRRGYRVALDVVGCEPPRPVPGFVTPHGFLDKRLPASRDRLAELFREAHLLILPTRADCVPMVIAEAYAHGLPVAVTDVGGVASVVEDGVTGRLLPLAADATAWATAVASMLASRDHYRSMALAALACFRRSLNWPAAVDRVVNLLKANCAPAHAA
jgi:glycosyltransferase involved in cell wall biosynthesis